MADPLFPWLKTRAAGVLLHPTSLPGSTGIGTLGIEARRFIDFLVIAGLKYWQVCPLGPTGFGDSPYQCFSAFAGNPYLIDLEALLERGFLESQDLDPLRSLPHEYVDYGSQWELRWKVLNKAYQAFFRQASVEEHDAFVSFKKSHRKWLEPYSCFIAIKTKFGGRSWQLWPEEYRHHENARQLIKKDGLVEEANAQAWYQFQFFDQWLRLKAYANSNDVSIFGDIPIFVAMDSADVWTHPALFQMDENLGPTGVAGVPPDYFAADGQLWGNPLYEWKKHKSSRYAWWLSRISGSFELYDVVRIDHFRGFDAYCRIPADAVNAREYEWIAGPGIDLFNAIHAQFPDAKFVAEDLGIITDSVRELVEATGAPGMKVLHFGLEGAKDYLPHNTVPNSVLYPGTHDNDTTLGWYRQQPESTKDFARRYFRITGENIAWDLIRAGYGSASRLFVVPAQDLLGLGSEARMNIPGTASGNWRWRLTADQMEILRSKTAPYLSELAALYDR
jgi:4-alpha-glucanotransferase